MKRVAAVGVLLCGCLGSEAFAQDTVLTTNSDKNIQVLQQKPFMRRLRAEVVPTFSVGLNETLTTHLGVGVQARFHVLDSLAIGGEYIHYFGSLSRLATEIGEDYQVYPEKRLIDWFAGGHVAWVPIFGKFVFPGASHVVYWDLFLVLGGGATHTGRTATRVTGDAGGGFRFAVLSFLTLNLEVRDYLYQETFGAGKKIMNNVVFTVGIGLFTPFGYTYDYPK